jgi:gliding motility-associated-like protein
VLQRIFTFALVLITAHLSGQVSFSANATSGCSPFGVVISVTSPAAETITSYAWTVTRPDGSVHTTSGSQYVAILSIPGTYDVSLTINGNQNQTIADYITVFANPTASFIVNDPVGCFPHAVTFSSTSTPGSGAIVTYNWDFGNGATGSGANPAYSYSQVGTYTPVLSIQDANGCIASVANPGMIQVVNTFPTVQFTASPPATCPVPAVVTFTNNSTGNGGVTTDWTFGNSGTASQTGTGAITHTFDQPGTYSVCAEVTDANGCVSESCQNVVILSQANPLFTVNNTTVCTGSAVNFTNQTTPATAQYSWNFNGDGIADSFSANPVYVFQTPGTYTPTLTATYSPTCSATFTGPTITVLPGLVVNFSADQTYSCEAPFQVTFTNNTFGAGITSNWFVNGQNVGTGSPFTYTFNSFGNYNITLLSANANGCSSQATQNNMIVIQPPAITFEHPGYICAEEVFEITNLNVTSASPIVNWSWDFDGDMIADATGQNPTWSFPNPGTYPITVFAETASGCTAVYTSPTEVTVLSPAVPNFTSSATVSCAGLSIEFCIPASNENQYSWNFGDATGWVTLNDGELCLTHDYQDTGYFDVTLTVFNQACNTTVLFEDYMYITPPVSIFDFNLDCGNLYEVSFGDLSIEADQLIWDFGDGSAPLTGEENPTHTFPGPGSYEVTLTAINDLIGCPDESSATLNLFPPDPSMDFTLTTDCPPALVQLSTAAQSSAWHLTISNGDVVHVEWSDLLDRWVVDYTHNGITEHNEYTASQNFWPMLIFEDAGCYDITVATTDGFGCVAEAFYPSAVCADSGTDFADFTWNFLDLCNSVELAFNPVGNNLVSWSWEFGDGAVSSAENPQHEYAAPYPYGDSLSVTLTATDTGGCVSTVTHDIPADFPVIPAFTVNNPNTCAGNIVQFTNSTEANAVSYTWTFGDPLSGSNNTSSDANPTHAYAQSGSYEVCLTAVNASGCARTTCVPAAVNVLTPEASFTFSSAFNSCLYGVTFTSTTTGTYDELFWDFGDGQTGSGEVAYHTYPLGVYDVTLIASNSTGCADTIVVNDIFNFAGMIGPFSADLDDVNCAPFDVTLTAYNPSDTYFSYFWDYNDGYGDPSGSTVSAHTYLEAGTFCPQLIMTDPNGCNVLIECTEPIVVEEFSLNYTLNDTICAGESTVITIFNGENHTWESGTPFQATGNAGEFVLNPASTDTFTLTGYYGDCISVHDITIQVNAPPSVALSAPASVCQGQPEFVLDGGSPAGSGGYYSINGTPATTFNPSSATGVYAVEYTFTDTNGCSNTADQIIEIFPLPVVQFTNPAMLCDNSSPIVLNGGTPAGGTYTMEGNPVSSFDPASGEGVYPVMYVYQDANGCVNTASTDITVSPSPEIDVVINTTCLDLPLDIVNNSTISSGSISQINWNLGGALHTGFDPANVIMAAAGTYPYTVTMTSNQGCISTASGSFAIESVPTAAFTYTVSCENDPTPFVSNSSIESGNIVSWEWVANDGPAGSGSQIDYVYAENTGATMTLTVTSSAGCDASFTQDVLVRPSPIVAMTHGPACAGTEIIFLGNASIEYGGVTGYTWTFGNSGITETGAQADHLFTSAGNQSISLTVTSNLGCSTTINESLMVYPTPQSSFVLDVVSVCGNLPIGLLDMSEVDAPSDLVNYAWYFDEELVSNSASSTIYAPGPGLYDVTLVVTTEAGCSDSHTEQQAVHVYPVPQAGFSFAHEEAFMSNPAVQIVNQASADVSSWEYHFGDGTTATFSSGVHQYATWDEFQIVQIVENTFGCADTASRTFRVNEEALIYIPNAFTPDGNGHNEGFKPVMSGFRPTLYSFTIFDRWGSMVYQTNDLDGCWNGQYRNEGEMSPDGAYNWQIDYRTEDSPVIQRMGGSVVLLR